MKYDLSDIAEYLHLLSNTGGNDPQELLNREIRPGSNDIVAAMQISTAAEVRLLRRLIHDNIIPTPGRISPSIGGRVWVLGELVSDRTSKRSGDRAKLCEVLITDDKYEQPVCRTLVTVKVGKVAAARAVTVPGEKR